MAEHYDTIVIGAGSSGGVAAARLAEDEGRMVLLLDAGPDFPDEAEVVPLFVASGEHTWRVSGVPEFDWGFVDRDRAERRGGRPIRLPRGRMVGGSSMVNSTIAARPAPFDHDRWAALGCAGWDWATVLPLYRRIETDRDFGDDPIHGKDGPIVIQRYAESDWAPVNRVFAESCAAMGVRHAPDLNGIDSDGSVFGPFPHNRFKEMKQGTLNTYIRAARKRPNLVVRGGALVDRVLVEGRRATGVAYVRDGRPATAHTDRVVVSAGVYNTPAILQRSGIGPAGLLARLGIPVVADLPAGIGLLDHPGCAVFFRVDGVSAMTGRLFPVTMRGPAGENGEPPWHIHPFPADQEDGLSGFFAYLCRQEGSGSVEIASRDPRVAPVIDHDYLAGEREYALFVQAYDEMRRIVETAPFAKRNARLLTEPRDFRHHLEGMLASAHHQSSSCRMGSDPEASVVDPRLRVHGVEGLLVADTSVFPDTIMHNTNLAAYVVGEKVADIIRGSKAPG